MSTQAMRQALEALTWLHDMAARGKAVDHLYDGDCPDELDRTRRDPACPACRALDKAAAAIAALRAALADDGWQPIETAPRDADILVYGLAQVWTDSCPVFWQGQAGWDEEYASWLTTAHDDKGEPLKVIPTHWMPLPAAPQPAHTLPDAPKD